MKRELIAAMIATMMVFPIIGIMTEGSDAAGDFQAEYVTTGKNPYVRCTFDDALTAGAVYVGEVFPYGQGGSEPWPALLTDNYHANVGVPSVLDDGLYVILFYQDGTDRTKAPKALFEVYSAEMILTNIHVTGDFRTGYDVGETFDIANATVYAHYSDGTERILSGTEYSYNPSGGLISEDDKVIFTYSEGKVTKTCEVNITVGGASDPMVFVLLGILVIAVATIGVFTVLRRR